LNRKD